MNANFITCYFLELDSDSHYGRLGLTTLTFSQNWPARQDSPQMVHVSVLPNYQMHLLKQTLFLKDDQFKSCVALLFSAELMHFICWLAVWACQFRQMELSFSFNY